MKKFLLSTTVVVIFMAYAIRLKAQGDDNIKPIVLNTYKPQLRYKNGTYTGDVADAFYGNIQVQVTISGGKIADVIFLQYPNDRQTSIEINSQAMPFLKQEAIAAQSAQVDGVSGASATSAAFIQSLQSALQKAV